MRHVRTKVGAALGGLLLASSLATGAGAQEPPPTVSVDALDGSIVTFTDCDGEETRNVTPALVAIRPAGDRPEDLSVDVTYGGTLTPGVDYETLPDPVLVQADGDATLLEISPTQPGTVTVTVEPGAGYQVGEPAAATAEVTLLQAVADCIDVGGEVQTIEVGAAPTAIDVEGRFGSDLADTFLSIEGEVPPGLTFTRDGTWTGAATEVGTFDFVARYCLSNDFCVFELPIRIIVVPRVDGPPPTAPPAVPISGAARLTG